MSDKCSGESVWTTAPNAEFELLKRLPQEAPSPEGAQELEDEARKEVAGRAEAYRTPVTPETLRLRML